MAQGTSTRAVTWLGRTLAKSRRFTVATVRPNKRSQTAITEGSSPAQPPVRISPHQFGHATQVGVDQLGELKAVTGSHADAVKEHGFGCRTEKPIDHVAGLGENRGRHHQRLIAVGKPVPAPRVVRVATVSQRDQDVRIDDDHELRTLPAEPLRQQLIHAFRQVRSPAVPDANESWQSRGLLIVSHGLQKRPEHAQRTRRLLLAQVSDKLLKLLLSGHPPSLSTMSRPSGTSAYAPVEPGDQRWPGHPPRASPAPGENYLHIHQGRLRRQPPYGLGPLLVAQAPGNRRARSAQHPAVTGRGRGHSAVTGRQRYRALSGGSPTGAAAAAGPLPAPRRDRCPATGRWPRLQERVGRPPRAGHPVTAQRSQARAGLRPVAARWRKRHPCL